MMRVAVLGVGAIGGLVASRLARAGCARLVHVDDTTVEFMRVGLSVGVATQWPQRKCGAPF